MLKLVEILSKKERKRWQFICRSFQHKKEEVVFWHFYERGDKHIEREEPL